MALDAALLHCQDPPKQQAPFAAGGETVPVVRIYRWKEPTISLGYFQNGRNGDVSEAIDAVRGQCAQVRRLTGGGAILHHHEITYSCAIGPEHPFTREPGKLYDTMHAAIGRLLSQCGVLAGFRSRYIPRSADSAAPPSHARRTDPAFFCFHRFDPHDLAWGEDPTGRYPKLVGSAQRRRRRSVLQHGSILMKSSPLLPDIPGILDICPGFDTDGFTAHLPEVLGRVLANQTRKTEYTDCERHFALQYQDTDPRAFDRVPVDS